MIKMIKLWEVCYPLLDRVKFFGLRKGYYLMRKFIVRINYRLVFFMDVIRPSLTSRFLSKTIINHFNGDKGHMVNEKDNFLGFGLLHYSLIRLIQPQRVLCIGSRKGFIPAILALACKDNRYGKVDFVDAGYGDEDNKAWSGVGFWKKNDSKKHFQFLGLNKWLKSYIMTTEEFAKKCPNRKYEYIYVDGDHSYEGVKLDYELFWPRLNKNGFMVFHDIVVKEWGRLKGFGVWRFWEELGETNKISFSFPKESGLGILQK